MVTPVIRWGDKGLKHRAWPNHHSDYFTSYRWLIMWWWNNTLEAVDACPLLELPDAIEFLLPIVCPLEIAGKKCSWKREKDVSFYRNTTSILDFSLSYYFLLSVVSGGQLLFSLLNMLLRKKDSKVFFFFYIEILEEILFILSRAPLTCMAEMSNVCFCCQSKTICMIARWNLFWRQVMKQCSFNNTCCVLLVVIYTSNRNV
jgi:hypothetical protein